MDKDIPSKYYVLFSDLVEHNIGDYFKSRNFKLYLSKANALEFWKQLYEEAGNSRGYYTFGMDVEKTDSEEAFKKLLQYLKRDDRVEDLVVEIIANFIKEKSSFADFSDIEESFLIGGFKPESIRVLKSAIDVFNSKNIQKEQKKDNKEISKKDVKAILKEKTELKSVFIVHGHNEAIKQTVARILEKQNLKPVILNEQTDNGLTIIEKLEKYSDVSFAIVLLTYDDFGNVKNIEEKKKRARQNVIMELGYFFAKLGRKNVLALYEKEVELPSDFSGILYTQLDDGDNWKYKMGKELKAAGFDFDLNHL